LHEEQLSVTGSNLEETRQENTSSTNPPAPASSLLPSDDKSNADRIASFLLAFSLFAVVMLALFIIEDIRRKTHNSWEYAAYLFPVLAGISAGYGVYVPKDAKRLFLFSCFFLAIGMVCYFLSKCAFVVAIITAVVLTVSAVLSLALGDFIDLRMKSSRVLKIIMIGALAALFLGTVGVLAVLMTILLS
jgi:hypothetical protein